MNWDPGPRSFVELDLRIFSGTGEGVFIEARFPWGEVNATLPPPPLAALGTISDAPAYWSDDLSSTYGKMLFEWLFQDELRTGFARAAALANPTTGRALRIRFGLEPKLGPVHRIRWEALYNRKDSSFLGLDTAFSRSLPGHVTDRCAKAVKFFRASNQLGRRRIARDEASAGGDRWRDGTARAVLRGRGRPGCASRHA